MNSPLAYIGGKSILSHRIIGMIPDHKTYIEAFAGAGWVFFRKPESRYEVINDLDSDLIAFYRVLQHHLEEFFKQFRWLLTSREWFEDWKRQQEAGGLTDIQRAARYYYLQRCAFGGKVSDRHFGVSPDRPPRINLLRIEEELSSVHLRLCRVVIENLPYQEILKRYDRPDNFFYLDPPYFQAPCYKHNFLKLDDYREMAELLGKLKGRFILSINDRPEIREIFGNFEMWAASLNYSVAQAGVTQGKELIIVNFNPQKKGK